MMREINNKLLDVDRSSSTMRKGKTAISKKELKIALVTKRLSMLQDDHEINPVLFLEDSIPCKSHKRGKVISDDESSEDKDLVTCIQPLKKRSHKRAKAVNDDESFVEDKEFDVCVQRSKNESQRMDISNPLSTCDKSSSMKRAEDVRANLPPENPSFVKLMLKSHVSGGFWLGLPKKFCDDHLPIYDSTIVLEDESGKKFNTKYLAAKVGLSGGWRGFSIDHELLEGDVLVFHLIAPAKFKIYIIRVQNFDEVDGALCLLNLESGVGQQTLDDNSHKIVLQTEEDCTLVDYVSPSISDVELGPEVIDGISFLDSDINFEAVTSFENFNIIVDDLVIDSKFSESSRKKYYELCCNQESFLHENLLKGLNCNLVVGIISETVNIADAIKSCKGTSTTHEDLQIWEKTLKGFELLGMKVAFLLSRVTELLGLASEHNTIDKSNRLKENIIKQAFAGERMKALENRLTQLKKEWMVINMASA